MTKTIRVLLTSYSGRFSGMEYRMLEEAKILLSEGATVAAATRKFPEQDLFKNELLRIEVPLFEFNPPPFLSCWQKRHLNYIQTRLRLRDFDWMRGYDVIRIFMPWGNRGLEHIYVASRLGVPALVSAHNTFGTKVLQTGWHDRFLHMSFQNVSGVYGLSQSALDNFASRFQNYMLDRTVRRVIPNAIDTDLFCPSGQAGSTLRASLGLSPDTKVIGCVGRLSTHKRPSFVIDVFERVVHTIPQNVHLVMIGNGELAKQCENEIENRNLQHHVTLIGRTQAVPDFMAGFDLHLLLSSVEGFGQVNIEAMACGVPSVATNVAGTNEVVRDGVDGFLVPVHDKEAACNRICEILENRDLAQTMGANGRQRAKASFSLEKRAKKICAFYEDALRSRIQNRSSEKVPFLETSS